MWLVHFVFFSTTLWHSIFMYVAVSVSCLCTDANFRSMPVYVYLYIFSIFLSISHYRRYPEFCCVLYDSNMAKLFVVFLQLVDHDVCIITPITMILLWHSNLHEMRFALQVSNAIWCRCVYSVFPLLRLYHYMTILGWLYLANFSMALCMWKLMTGLNLPALWKARDQDVLKVWLIYCIYSWLDFIPFFLE